MLFACKWFSTRILLSINKFSHTNLEVKKTDLIIQIKPSIVVDNYSGIDKKDYHEEAEEKINND